MFGKREPKKPNRFDFVVGEEVVDGEIHILRDKQTGVQYLFYKYYNSGGLTPLLDSDGKPVVG